MRELCGTTHTWVDIVERGLRPLRDRHLLVDRRYGIEKWWFAPSPDSKGNRLL